MSMRIDVTRPSLPPLKEYTAYLERIWESGILTHHGPLVQELERQLTAYLRVEHLATVVNGTVAIQFAIRALNLTKEIITTPFTFIATASSVVWERCAPIFVDVQFDDFNIDPKAIEQGITRNTQAILGVHVFSAPCDVLRIGEIARANSLRVIYDAAHAMGVEVEGRSLLEYGDISAVSFHATKLFNTVEGGACVSQDPEHIDRIRRFRFFGFDESKQVIDDGINGKMTEVSAAMGLANLKHLDTVRVQRRADYELYEGILGSCPGVRLQRYQSQRYNFSYFPIILPDEDTVNRLVSKLNELSIFPRRYFYPALNTIGRLGTVVELPVAEEIARRVLCLPLYYGIEAGTIRRICEVVYEASSRHRRVP